MNNNKASQKSSSPYCISWAALVVAVLFGFGLSFLFDRLSSAICFYLFSTTNTAAMLIALIGLTITLGGLVLAMFAAGYTAGYLGALHSPQGNLGLFYGFSTWSLVLILNALLAVPLQHYLAKQSASLALVLPDLLQTGGNHAKTQTETAFIVFILFFMTAFFSCLGAYWGMTRQSRIC